MPGVVKDTFAGGVITWDAKGIKTADRTSSPIRAPGAADRTLQAFGTWGASAALTVQGSNQREAAPANWFTVHKSDGAAFTLTADGGDVILENCLQVRVILADGDSSTDIDIIVTTRG